MKLWWLYKTSFDPPNATEKCNYTSQAVLSLRPDVEDYEKNGIYMYADLTSQIIAEK